MALIMLAGVCLGAGMALLIRGWFPPPLPLPDALAPAARTARLTPLVTTDAGGWAALAGQPFSRLLAGLGLPTPGVRRDLTVLGRPVERHLAEQATALIAGVCLLPALTVLLAAAGAPLPPAVPVWGSIGLGVAGAALPNLVVHAAATTRRAEVRHALAAVVDLVVITLAGGAGVEAALGQATRIGEGWACTQIRRAVDAATLARRPPWQELARLGHELGADTLTELAATLTLAGAEGARVRSSLAAKATALRTHELAEAEAAAQAATERMSLPVVGLFTGFLVFIGFPALAHIISGF